MTKTDTQGQLTGLHVLIMLLLFFGVMFAVNIFFTFKAVTTFRGEDVKRSYRQGLDYNQTLERRAAQDALGWSVAANLQSEAEQPVLIVSLDDQAGQGLRGLTIEAVAIHRVDTKHDQALSFKAIGDGRYAAKLGEISGPYTLKANARIEGAAQDAPFYFEHKFTVQ